MADMRVETTETGPSAATVANNETVSGAQPVSGAKSVGEIDVEARTSAAPSINEVKEVIADIKTQDEPNGTNQDSSVETKGHEIPDATAKGAEAMKEVSVAAPNPLKVDVEKTEQDSHTNKDSSQNNSKPADRKGFDHKLSSNRGRKHGSFHSRPRQDYSENVKSDLTSQEESSDPVAIRKQVRKFGEVMCHFSADCPILQVEFYFSDSNLHMDKFLLEKVDGHKNLPVPISIIHSFKRMRHFQPFSAIIDALKSSTVLDVVENDSCVQRKIPMAEDLKDKPIHEVQKVYEDKAMAQSVYVKGFGDEQPSTQFDIEAFFAPHGPTNSVRLRRHPDKMFKGSVFVEFDSEATQKAFLALDPKPKWKGKDLQIKSKRQYCDAKVDDINAGKIRSNQERGSHDQHKSKRPRDHDDRDWRERRDEDRKRGFRDDRKDRGHKGFGTSGRGRGRGRGGRGGGDRNGERNRQQKEQYVTLCEVNDSNLLILLKVRFRKLRHLLRNLRVR